MGIENSYQESADDIYRDLISEIDILVGEYEKDNASDDYISGMMLVLDLIKEKRAEFYA